MAVDLNVHLCFNLYRGWREISSFYKDALGSDVSPQNIYILQLCDFNKKITMSELAAAMHLDGSAISTLVSRMEKKSLVERIHGTKDRRCVYVKLMAKGDAFKARMESKIIELTQNATKGISKADIDALQVVVNKITDNRLDYRGLSPL